MHSVLLSMSMKPWSRPNSLRLSLSNAHTLLFASATEFLLAVLLLLALFAANSDARRLLVTILDQTVLWLVLLSSIDRVIDESEASGLSTSEASLQAEDGDSLRDCLHALSL